MKRRIVIKIILAILLLFATTMALFVITDKNLNQTEAPASTAQFLYDTGCAAVESFSAADIKYISYTSVPNDLPETIFIDFPTMTRYYGVGYEFLDDFDAALRSTQLTESELCRIFDSIDKCKIYTWNQQYVANREDNIMPYKWMLGIQLNNGAIYSYCGGGLFTGAPYWDSFDNLVEIIAGSTSI